MKFIEKYKIDNDTLKMTLVNKDTLKLSFVNALRRIILSEIPIYILDNIEYIENNSSLNDQILGRRLNLLPVINENTDNYNDIEIELDVQNNNEEQYITTVYASDFKVNNSNKKISDLIKFPKIIFTKLKFGNKVHLKSKLIKDTALNSGSAYCPVNIMTILFQKDEKKIKKMLIDIKDPKKRDDFIKYDSNRIYLKNDKNEPEKYNVTIETSGVMKLKTILLSSLDVIENKIKLIKSNYINKDNEDIIIKKQESSLGGIDIILKNENDTIGNLLSSYLLDSNKVKIASYNIPHPLINEMLIRFTLKNDSKIEEYNKVFFNTIDNILKILNDLKKDFKSIS
jgi:DNA-directed RNA polymerase subunit L